MKIKIITGFRKDQEHSIDISEAHKAYYLFLHPEVRSIFSDGLAIKGSDIQSIVPDYQATMGWNTTHVLGDDDMAEIKKLGVDRKIRDMMARAKEVAMICKPQDLNQSLEALVESVNLKLN